MTRKPAASSRAKATGGRSGLASKPAEEYADDVLDRLRNIDKPSRIIIGDAIREAEARGMEEAARIAKEWGSYVTGSRDPFEKKYGTTYLLTALADAAAARRKAR